MALTQVSGRQQTDRLESIQALRGVAAVLVVAFHWRGILDGKERWGHFLFSGGFIGVDLFFLISGFIIVLVTRSEKEQRVIPFAIKRAYRLFPPAWLAIFCQHLVVGGTAAAIWTDHDILRSLLFIPRGGEPPFLGYSYLAVLWTLTYEVIFYGVFAFAMSISGRFRTLLSSVVLVVLVSLLQYRLTGTVVIDPYAAPTYVGPFPRSLASAAANPLLLEFIPGMLLAEVYSRLPKRNYASWPAYVGILSILLFMSALTTYPMGLKSGLLSAGPWCLLLVSGLLVWERLGTFRAPKVLLDLGALTYSLYLFHVSVRTYLDTLGSPFPGMNGVSKLLFYFVVTIVVSAGVYWGVEKPMIKVGRSTIRWYERLLEARKNIPVPSWLKSA